MRVTQQAVVAVAGTEFVGVVGPAKTYVGISVLYMVDVVGGEGVTPVGPFTYSLLLNGTIVKSGSSTSPSFDISYAFPSAGSYSLQVSVKDNGNGITSTSNTLAVTISPLLVAGLTASPLSGAVPLAVSFAGHITSPGFTPGIWSLNFGDGSAPVSGGYSAAGDLPTQTHTYTAAGTFTAVLTVTDALGIATQQSLTIRPGVLAVSIMPILVAAPTLFGVVLVAYVGWKKGGK